MEIKLINQQAVTKNSCAVSVLPIFFHANYKIMTVKGLLAALLGAAVVGCCGGGGGGGNGCSSATLSNNSIKPFPDAARVGFFTPDGSRAELVNKVQLGMVIAHSPDELANNLKVASGTSFKVNVDFGAVLAHPMSVYAIKMTYRDPSGTSHTKVFPPLSATKLRQFPSNEQIKVALAPFFDVLKQYSPNVGVVFLADEPYLKGIQKSEMERVGAVARQELDARGLQSIKLGVNFASGMFDARFATMMDEQAGKYAKNIDQFQKSGQAPPEWVQTITTARLSTYDTAGNMYTDGGIPDGYDVVGFDFYLSTILLDALHEQTLSWFAKNYPDAGCKQFDGVTMTQIRSRLSFFDHDSMQPGTQAADKMLLDAIYQCRMQATTEMLQHNLGRRHAHLLLISESSNNGVLEFSSDGIPKKEQPAALVEARVLDEVHRAEQFFSAYQEVYTAGLLFFTYENTYDKTINLNIGGASAMPSVMNAIIGFSASFAAR